MRHDISLQEANASDIVSTAVEKFLPKSASRSRNRCMDGRVRSYAADCAGICGDAEGWSASSVSSLSTALA